MKCPIDSTDLLISARTGVEIDYCPQCRGVWLDRGELDKIIDRGGYESRGENRSQPSYYPPESDRSSGHGHDRGSRDQSRNGRRRREGFLGELFDF